jgi:hypothetical protein
MKANADMARMCARMCEMCADMCRTCADMCRQMNDPQMNECADMLTRAPTCALP